MSQENDLPRHLREPRDKTSEYYNGLFAQRHPNTYYGDENSISIVLAMLKRAQDALTKWAKYEAGLSIPAAEDIKIAFEALSDIEHHLPRLALWCV